MSVSAHRMCQWCRPPPSRSCTLAVGIRRISDRHRRSSTVTVHMICIGNCQTWHGRHWKHHGSREIQIPALEALPLLDINPEFYYSISPFRRRSILAFGLLALLPGTGTGTADSMPSDSLRASGELPFGIIIRPPRSPALMRLTVG